MALKTNVHAEEGRHDLLITRTFDLPVSLLFRAYVEAEIVEQWMGTNVIKLESRRHGGWEFETRDPEGKPVFRASGVIHDFVPDKLIVRTFEMENAPFGAQLEFLEFIPLGDETSKLEMQIVYRSIELRDQMLKLPFAKGLNMGHNRLEEIAKSLKQ